MAFIKFECKRARGAIMSSARDEESRFEFYSFEYEGGAGAQSSVMAALAAKFRS